MQWPVLWAFGRASNRSCTCCSCSRLWGRRLLRSRPPQRLMLRRRWLLLWLLMSRISRRLLRRERIRQRAMINFSRDLRIICFLIRYMNIAIVLHLVKKSKTICRQFQRHNWFNNLWDPSCIRRQHSIRMILFSTLLPWSIIATLSRRSLWIRTVLEKLWKVNFTTQSWRW